jgi:hypothetical protein
VLPQEFPPDLEMTSPTAPPSKSPFAAMVGAKRRRMRSGGNVSTLSNNNKKEEPDLSDMDDDDETTAQTSKCKGATTIPIFLKSKFWVKTMPDIHLNFTCWKWQKSTNSRVF